MPKDTKKKNPLEALIAGGCAGLVESSVCHPLDTIKTRMQLRKNAVDPRKLRNSFVEPALRLKHSLQEPALRLKHSLQEPFMRPEPTLSGGGGAALSKSHVHEPGFAKVSGEAVGHARVVIKPTQHRGTVQATLGPFGTAKRIVQREGFFSLYKGLSAVYTGIVPKMAIRFLSFEMYKDLLDAHTTLGRSTSATFTAGLMSGLTEAILVVTPAEVCKIRMQSQYHSMADPAQMAHRKYRNVFQTAYTIIREEGVGALYKGVVPTMLRQGCNQAVNFTAYNLIKNEVMERQHTTELASYQSLMIGGFSGGMGPLVNNPLDVVKTRLQKQVVHEGKQPKYTGLVQACVVIAKEEGGLALWKGITPRLLRIMPGQAITFMTYEYVRSKMHKYGFLSDE
jgi:solute carrier family 25 citrate transporter 1